jgi:phospholipase C
LLKDSLHTPAVPRVLYALLAAAAIAGCGSGASPGAAPPQPMPASTAPIQHVIIIVQENRTPDNLFHGLAGADIANVGTTSTGRHVTLAPITLIGTYDLGHAHSDWLREYDGGTMDGANNVGVFCPNKPCMKDPQFTYVDPSLVQPYFQMAQTYVFADRMFQTNEGPSFSSHQYIIAGTSLTTPTSNLYALDNPNLGGGCVAQPNDTVDTIYGNGIVGPAVAPCFEHQTLMDLLDAARVSWRYYTPDPGSLWTAPASIGHIRSGPDWSHVIIPQSQVLTDIASGRLADVSWVMPDAAESDHAIGNQGLGPSWVASIVNAVGASKYWAHTAIFITWDDWGGFYDHVPPPTLYNANELGFRVPLIVVSPYAKTAYVSHVNHEFGSILHFVEETFSLGSLNYSDSRSDDLQDCFDYTQTPRAFSRISSSVNQAYFLKHPTSSGEPDDE